MAGEKEEIHLVLKCDLEQASKFYDVVLDDIEIREYTTPFTINNSHSSMSLSLGCAGCNEQIKIDIIELPRINNIKSSSFIVQIGIILTLILLPSTNVNIDPLSIYVLAVLGVLFFTYEMYSFFIRAPARLDTLFFWHSINTIEDKHTTTEQPLSTRAEILPDTSDNIDNQSE